MQKSLDPVWRYLTAILAVATIVVLRLTVEPFFDDNAPFLFLTLAVIFAAWFGKFQAGLLATILSAIVGLYLFTQPYYSFENKTRSEYIGLISFLIIGVVISLIVEQLHRAKSVAEEKAKEAQREAAEREEAEKTARESEERFRNVADTAPVLIWLSNTNKVCTWVNKPWLDFTGQTLEEEIGQVLTDRVHPEDFQRCLDTYQTSFNTKRSFSIESRLRRKDGEYRWIINNGVPHFGTDGAFLGFIGSCIDIHERKQVEQEREQLLTDARKAYAQAAVASRMKDEFLATVSHELRTPLNAILGWTQMVKNGIVGPDQFTKAIDTIERNARSQAQLIEDLLDVTRIVSGKLRLNIREVDLVPVISAALDTVRPAAEAKSITLEKTFTDLPSLVSGDPDRLQQVVWNLLSNAIKFTPKGGRIEVKLERVHSQAQITVIDTGKGIEPEFLPYVFERFRQADGSTTRKHGGLGLGLAIVKNLVELHGGQVSAHSGGDGTGATFAVQLPLRAVANFERQESKTNGNSNILTMNLADLPDLSLDLEGLRILVVDDEQDARELLRALLTSFGAEVTICASANEAFTQTRLSPPHLLISDIGMPDEDGYSLIQRIRELPKNEGGQTPAIALTAYTRIENRIQALSAGFQMFVPKPVEPSELIAAIRTLAGFNGNFASNETRPTQHR